MHSLLIVAALSTTFTVYPGFTNPQQPVEAKRDLGPVYEFTIKCPLSTGIMAYSKVEKLFCTSDWTCYRELQAAIDHLCKQDRAE